MKLGRSLLWFALVVAIAHVLYADMRQLEENSTWEAQTDLVITNAQNLSDIFIQGFTYPDGAWVWTPREFDPTTLIWANGLPPELAGVTNLPTRDLHGVPAWPLWITLYPQNGTAGEISVLYPWSNSEMFRIAVPQGFDSRQAYQKVLRDSCVLDGINYTNWEALIEQGYNQFSTPQVTVHAWLMDFANQDTYYSNFIAEMEAQQEAEDAARDASALTEQRQTTMLVDSQPCVITNDSETFAILSISQDTNRYTTISWQSCGDHIYAVFSTEELSTNTQWSGRASMWGADGMTSWTDTETTEVTNRFYRVIRMSADGDFDGDGMPNGWEVDNHLNPLVYDAYDDPDADTWVNLYEYIAGTDPHDSASYFHVVGLPSIVGDDVRVFFASVTNRYYNLQRADYSWGPFSNIVTNIPGNGGVQWAKDIGGALVPNRWYRVSVFIATNIPPDSDSDGMPDLWTQQYFGHPTGLLADLSRPGDNPDGDCFSNLQEYQNSTDPTNSDPVATVNGGSVICLGSTLNLLASTIQGATYSWTGPNGFASTNQNPSITNVTANMAGSYCVKATSSGCSITNCVTVTVHIPTATVSGSNTICLGMTNSIQATLKLNQQK